MDNTTAERPTFVTHLECSMTGKSYPADKLHGLSEAGKPLLVRYDLDGLGKALSRDKLQARPADMWRYREFLPVRQAGNIVSLGEIMTPIIRCRELARDIGGGALYVKDEGRLPTGSFKARGLCLAVSMARELGITAIAMPTNGNAGAAMAAYASRAGMQSYVFCPDDTPSVNVREIAAQGAEVWMVNGLITDCGKIVGGGTAETGWFDVSTLKEPYRIEGKKTMGLELAEQFGWDVPDVIFYPTGGGTGLIGMWKAFDELAQIGWLGEKRPRMVAVQASGCAPIVKAYEDGADHAVPWENAHTVAAAFASRRPSAIFSSSVQSGKATASPSSWMTMRFSRAATKWPAARGCCSAPKGRPPMRPTRKRWPAGWSPKTNRLCSTTAPPASSTNCRQSIVPSTGISQSITRACRTGRGTD